MFIAGLKPIKSEHSGSYEIKHAAKQNNHPGSRALQIKISYQLAIVVKLIRCNLAETKRFSNP